MKYGLLAVALAHHRRAERAHHDAGGADGRRRSSVPSLVGKPVPEAGALAARQRLLLRVEGKRNDPQGGRRTCIVEQEPAGGLDAQDASAASGSG